MQMGIESIVEEVGYATPIKNADEMMPPHEGMEFESIDQARKYNEEYERKEGFWIKIRTSTKSKPRSDLVTRIREMVKKPFEASRKTKDGMTLHKKNRR
ncbi:hypothetical protein GIB67_002138 [Kingdonia uniflora]|uniref:Uncharacterized protein n=1 Tax=Kingdonia uniflora TaxID=39325 RepID=A0A7J7KWL8_9MAGN|nr:hypothetical protein GIB67_002138 [Kingdonia uniflora]